MEQSGHAKGKGCGWRCSPLGGQESAGLEVGGLRFPRESRRVRCGFSSRKRGSALGRRPRLRSQRFPGQGWTAVPARCHFKSRLGCFLHTGSSRESGSWDSASSLQSDQWQFYSVGCQVGGPVDSGFLVPEPPPQGVESSRVSQDVAGSCSCNLAKRKDTFSFPLHLGLKHLDGNEKHQQNPSPLSMQDKPRFSPGHVESTETSAPIWPIVQN
ncbi:uncharacterized protein LOC125086715 [Lutra lutra]|uniref:uncharacterized protein LOC125086715 n=1 Tax=Lutra lutra TaxID=9657 RepID=UPI001FCFCC2A|nr:uncharacterized protein LOC125086715 [Lutra lutra]